MGLNFKIRFVAIAAVMGCGMSLFSADAQGVDISNVIPAPGMFNIIPSEYTLNHDRLVVIPDFSSSDNSTRLRVLDAALNECMNVTVENTPYAVKRYYEEYTLKGEGYYILSESFESAGRDITSAVLNKESATFDEVNDYVNNVGPKSYYVYGTRCEQEYINETHDECIYWYPMEHCGWDSYRSGLIIDLDQLSGSNYAYYFYKLDKDGHVWMMNNLDVRKIMGDWVYSERKEVESGVKYSTSAQLEIFSDGESPSYTGRTYTQTLFNDDEDLEYVEFQYQVDPTVLETEWQTEWDNNRIIRKYAYTEASLIANGVVIRNTKNQTLASMVIPAGFSISTLRPVQILDLGSHRYMVLSIFKDNESFYQIFEINRTSSAILPVGAPMRSRGIPGI